MGQGRGRPASPTSASSCLKNVSSALSRCAARRCTVKLVVRGENDSEGSSCEIGGRAHNHGVRVGQAVQSHVHCQEGRRNCMSGWSHRWESAAPTLRASSAAFLIKSLRAL